jgi:hypothetical protein
MADKQQGEQVPIGFISMPIKETHVFANEGGDNKPETHKSCGWLRVVIYLNLAPISGKKPEKGACQKKDDEAYLLEKKNQARGDSSS